MAKDGIVTTQRFIELGTLIGERATKLEVLLAEQKATEALIVGLREELAPLLKEHTELIAGIVSPTGWTPSLPFIPSAVVPAVPVQMAAQPVVPAPAAVSVPAPSLEMDSRLAAKLKLKKFLDTLSDEESMSSMQIAERTGIDGVLVRELLREMR